MKSLIRIRPFPITISAVVLTPLETEVKDGKVVAHFSMRIQRWWIWWMKLRACYVVLRAPMKHTHDDEYSA